MRIIFVSTRRRLSEIKLKRTDTTLDLSQKAKEACKKEGESRERSEKISPDEKSRQGAKRKKTTDWLARNL
jgi:hypothetical protein